jgi:hypothetical protein
VSSSLLQTSPLRYQLLCKGLHLRGYTLTEKPFYMSWDQFFEGAAMLMGNSIFSGFKLLPVGR